MTRYLLLIGLVFCAFSQAGQVSGSIREIRRIAVDPISFQAEAEAGRATPVATISIDNNLPDYTLVLDFGADAGISQVSLEEIGGVLGEGLPHPWRTALAPGAVPGQFVWNPGTQKSATVAFQVRVLVTWTLPPRDGRPLTVSLAPED